MKQLVALVMIAFLVPATATVAFAKNACKGEKAKFCKDAKTAGKKVNDCLKEHIAEVSPACKEQLEKPKEPKTDKEKADKKISPPRRSPQSQLLLLPRPRPRRLHRLVLPRASNDAPRRAVAVAARPIFLFRLRA